ncbi:MAG: helix-turn-helix transcriptional regulator [Lachnospiraceae bacterium]|nr:helix-turn-helix transcriptional regulator [Lachnospiraceae bacterium]
MERKKRNVTADADELKGKYGFAPGELGILVVNDVLTGENLRNLMENAGHNVEELAQVLGVSRRLVYLWLSGKSGIRPEHALRLGAIYGVHLEELYGFDIIIDR